jgi:type I restriction enzyme S subunit
MKYEAYPDYTPTRWATTRRIPTKWEARRLKFAVTLRNEKIEAEDSCLDYMGLEHIESWTGKRIEDESAASEGIATRFVKDDVLFGKLRPYLAKVYLAEKEGMATTEALILSSDAVLVPKFLKYLLISDKFINAVSGTTYGAKMPRANWDAIGSIPILLPTRDEQQQIAAFLVWKTGQIDALIARKKELLEKLKEKRLAVITQAVNRGESTAPGGGARGVAVLRRFVPIHFRRLAGRRDRGHHPCRPAAQSQWLDAHRNQQPL